MKKMLMVLTPVLVSLVACGGGGGGGGGSSSPATTPAEGVRNFV